MFFKWTNMYVVCMCWFPSTNIIFGLYQANPGGAVSYGQSGEDGSWVSTLWVLSCTWFKIRDGHSQLSHCSVLECCHGSNFVLMTPVHVALNCFLIPMLWLLWYNSRREKGAVFCSWCLPNQFWARLVPGQEEAGWVQWQKQGGLLLDNGGSQAVDNRSPPALPKLWHQFVFKPRGGYSMLNLYAY